MKRLLFLILIISLSTNSYAAEDSEQYMFKDMNNDTIKHNITYGKNDGRSKYLPKIDFDAGKMHYDNTRVPEVYLEVKNGKYPGRERFEAMAGVPSKEFLHMDMGLRTMYCNADMEIRDSGTIVNKPVFSGKTSFHCPNYIEDKLCECKINWDLTFQSVGKHINITIKKDDPNCIVSLKNDIDYAINEIKTKMGESSKRHNYGEPSQSCSGISEFTVIKQAIKLPACITPDNTTVSIDVPVSIIGECAEGGDCKEEFTFSPLETINHCVNGWVSPNNDGGLYSNWQTDPVKLVATGQHQGYNKKLLNQSGSGITNETPNGWTTSITDNNKNSNIQSHFYDRLITSDMVNYVTLGKNKHSYPIAVFSRTPSAKVLDAALVYLGKDQNYFDYLNEDNTRWGQSANVGTTYTFGYTHFRNINDSINDIIDINHKPNSLTRNNIDLVDRYRFSAGGDTSLIPKGSDGKEAFNKNILDFYGQFQPRSDFDTGFIVTENYSEGLTIDWSEDILNQMDTAWTKDLLDGSNDVVESRDGCGTAQFLKAFHKSDNQDAQDEVYEKILKDWITNINSYYEWLFKVQNPGTDFKMFYLPDRMSTKAFIFRRDPYWDTTVCWSGIGLKAENDSVMKLDTLNIVRDTTVTSSYGNAKSSIGQEIESKDSNISVLPVVDITSIVNSRNSKNNTRTYYGVSVEWNKLYNEEVESWTSMRDASKFYFAQNLEVNDEPKRGYELYGYSGNYKVSVVDNKADFHYKSSGIWPGSLGNLCYIDTNGLLQSNNDIESNKAQGITLTWWPYRYKGEDTPFLSSDMYVVDDWKLWEFSEDGRHARGKLVTGGKFIKIKAGTPNGVYQPIEKIEAYYVDLPRSASGGNICPGLGTIGSGNKIVSSYMNLKADGPDPEDWFYGIAANADYNRPCNDIVIRDPATVQFCKFVSNPSYMDQRIGDNLVHRGGNSNSIHYEIKEEVLKSKFSVINPVTNEVIETREEDNVLYQGAGNKYRTYLNKASEEYALDINTRDPAAYQEVDERKENPSTTFVNIAKEFEMIFSDQMDFTKDEFGQPADTKENVDFYGIECKYYLSRNNDKMYSQDLIGLPTISDVLGYGWGPESMKDGKLYASYFPSNDQYGLEEGAHNYVKARFIYTPFDMTLQDQSGRYFTVKANHVLNLNDIAQYVSSNEDQNYTDLSDVNLDGKKFKTKGRRHPREYDNGNARDINFNQCKDRLIYGLCLMSNNEQANATGWFCSFADNYLPSDTFDENYYKKAEYLNFKKIPDADLNENQYNPIARVFKYVDLVGMIGNLCLNDTGDFRFANLFKQSAEDGTYYVENLIPKVKVTSPRAIMQMKTNILDDSNLVPPAGNVTGSQRHKEQYSEDTSLPISAAKNNIAALRTEQLRPGYAQYWDVETIGNYNGLNSDYDHLTNRVIIKPYYYLYNYDTNTVEKLNVYYKDQGEYKLGNKFDHELYDDNFGSIIFQDKQSLINRSNVTNQEIDITNDVMSHANLKTSMYTNIINDQSGTTNMSILDMNNRDYIGSRYLRGQDTIGENTSIVRNGFNNGSDIEHIYEGDFKVHNQKYYCTINLPTSAIFVMARYDIGGRDYDASAGVDYEAEYQKVKDINGCILQTVKIQAFGEYWSLQYKSRATANNDIVKLTNSQNLRVRRSDLEGELIAVIDNKFNASDDINLTGLY